MKRLKKLGLLTLFAALMVFTAACGGGTSTDKNATSDQQEVNNE